MERGTQADIALLSVVILWGTSFSIAKEALQWITPVLFVVVRFLLAGAIWLVVYGHLLKKNQKNFTWKIALKGSLLGVVLGAGFVLQTAGLNLTRATMSGFLTGLVVVIVPFFVIILERKIPKATSLTGVVVCTFGLWVLTSSPGAGFNFGDLLTIGAAVFFALHLVLVQIFTREHDPRVLTLMQPIGALLVAIPLIFILESPSVTIHWSLVWRWLVLGTMVAVTIAVQLYWQRFITATRAAIIFTLEQPLAAFFAFLILGEVLTGRAYLGGGLIFIGMLVAEGGARILPGRLGALDTSP